MAIQSDYDDSQVNQSRTGLFIDIVPEVLERIKEAAARRNLSLQEYVRRVLERSVSSEADIQAREERTRELEQR